MSRSVLLALILLVACDDFPLTREVEPQKLGTVAAALERDEDAKVLEFPKAIARTDLLGFKPRSVRGPRSREASKQITVMIPLVDEGWTKDQLIAVWVRLDGSGERPDDPKIQAKIDEFVAATKAGPIRVNATQTLPEKVDMDGTNAFTIGAKRAMQEHGLVSPVGAVLATWPAMTTGRLRFKD